MSADPYARWKTQAVDCPTCGEPIPVTEDDQTVVCPDPACAKRWAVSYDAEWTADRGWHGRYLLSPTGEEAPRPHE